MVARVSDWDARDANAEALLLHGMAMRAKGSARWILVGVPASRGEGIPLITGGVSQMPARKSSVPLQVAHRNSEHTLLRAIWMVGCI